MSDCRDGGRCALWSYICARYDYRPATLEDARRLFAWRNDDLTRTMSRSSDVVEWSDHVNWIAARLAREQPHLYVAEIGGVAVGTFQIDDGEISYTVAPEHRSRGFCTAMLKLARAHFGPLGAEIYRRNEPSIKAARAAGFEVVLLD